MKVNCVFVSKFKLCSAILTFIVLLVSPMYLCTHYLPSFCGHLLLHVKYKHLSHCFFCALKTVFPPKGAQASSSLSLSPWIYGVYKVAWVGSGGLLLLGVPWEDVMMTGSS